VNPGDIAIERTPDGYAVARQTVTRDGTEAWWHSIAVVVTLEDVAYLSKALADRDGVRAWIRTRGGDYELLQNQDSISFGP
jgi:hypothetical protein